MTPLFKKMNLGSLREIVLIHSPDSFAAERTALEATGIQVHTDWPSHAVLYVLIFVQTEADIEAASQKLSAIPGDAQFWFAYPKKTSKKYISSINRDNGWQALGQLGLEGVRQVAIDDDWSALRFRRVEFITNLTRDKSWRLSDEGKNRT